MRAVAYFTLTFAVSWSGILLVIGGPGAIPGGAQARDDPRFPLVYLAMLAGPVLASLLVIGLTGGRSAFRTLWQRLTTWRVPGRWYAIALLTAPLVVAIAIGVLSLLSPSFTPAIFGAPDKSSALLFGLGVGLGAGIFEELGWTGCAVPMLRQRFSIVVTGLITGVVWAAWHVLAVLWGIGDAAGTIPIAAFVALDLMTCLPAYRVLMVWVYDRTGSLLLAMLMHASLTATLLIFGPSVTGSRLLAYDAVVATCLWGAVAVALSVRFSAPERRILSPSA